MKERPWHSIGGKRQSLIRNGVQNKPNEKKRSKSEKKKTLFCGLVYIYIYLAALSRTKYGKPPLIYICRIYQQTHVYSGIQRRLLPGGNISLSIIPLLPLTHALAIAAAAFVLIFISRHAESISILSFSSLSAVSVWDEFCKHLLFSACLLFFAFSYQPGERWSRGWLFYHHSHALSLSSQ